MISTDFWKGEFVAALFDVQYKQTELGPYPSTTLFKVKNESNGWAEPDPESQISVVGSVKIAVGVTVVWWVNATAGPHVSP